MHHRVTAICARAMLAALSVALVTGGYGFVASGGHLAARRTSHHPVCELPHCFSITTSADGLSVFAGVLTALTFSAVVFLLGRDQRHRSELPSTIILFTAAFVSLILSTYLYTDAAAEEAASLRAAAVSFAASIALGIAILQLFLGLAHLVQRHGASTFLVRVASWFIGPAVFYFLMATAVNAWGLEMTSSAEWHSALAHGTELLLAMWIFAAVQPWPLPRCATLVTWATLSLVAVAIATFFVGYWGEEEPHAAPPAAAYFGAMTILLLVGLGYSSLLRRLIEKRPTPRVDRSSATRSLPHLFERRPPD
jgi:hypothetical protein